jgi:hypothetical protein
MNSNFKKNRRRSFDDVVTGNRQYWNDIIRAKEDFEARLYREIELRMFAEDVVDDRQRELEDIESENERLSDDRNNLTAEVLGLREQLDDLRQRFKETEQYGQTTAQQLKDARDHIFRLQPRRREITETEAQEAFKNLFDKVQRWVQNRLTPILDELDGGVLKNRPVHMENANRLLSLVREPAKHCFTTNESDEYHIIALIMQYLCSHLFNKSFYCPLESKSGERTAEFIDEIVLAMRQLPRGEWSQEELKLPGLILVNANRMLQISRTAEIGEVRH